MAGADETEPVEMRGTDLMLLLSGVDVAGHDVDGGTSGRRESRSFLWRAEVELPTLCAVANDGETIPEPRDLAEARVLIATLHKSSKTLAQRLVYVEREKLLLQHELDVCCGGSSVDARRS